MKSPKVFAFFFVLLATLAGQGNAQVTTRAAAAAATHASTAAAAAGPALTDAIKAAVQYVTWDGVKGACVWVGGSVSATQAAGVAVAVGVRVGYYHREETISAYHHRHEILAIGVDAYHQVVKGIIQVVTHTGSTSSSSSTGSDTDSTTTHHHQQQQAPPPPPAGLNIPLPNHGDDAINTNNSDSSSSSNIVETHTMPVNETNKVPAPITPKKLKEPKTYTEEEMEEQRAQTQKWLKAYQEADKKEKAQQAKQDGVEAPTQGQQADASFQAKDGAQTKTYAFSFYYFGVAVIVILCVAAVVAAVYHYVVHTKLEQDSLKATAELIKEEASSGSSTPTTSPSKRQRGSSADRPKSPPPSSPSTAAAPAPGATHTHTGTHTGKKKGKGGGYLSAFTGRLGDYLNMGTGKTNDSMLLETKGGDDKEEDGTYVWNPRMGKTGKNSPNKKKSKGYGKKK